MNAAEKECSLREIELQNGTGVQCFLDMDKSLAMVTLKDMEASGGESQEYWLLAVQTAWAAKALADGLSAGDAMPN